MKGHGRKQLRDGGWERRARRSHVSFTDTRAPSITAALFLAAEDIKAEPEVRGQSLVTLRTHRAGRVEARTQRPVVTRG